MVSIPIMTPALVIRALPPNPNSWIPCSTSSCQPHCTSHRTNICPQAHVFSRRLLRMSTGLHSPSRSGFFHRHVFPGFSDCPECVMAKYMAIAASSDPDRTFHHCIRPLSLRYNLSSRYSPYFQARFSIEIWV